MNSQKPPSASTITDGGQSGFIWCPPVSLSLPDCCESHPGHQAFSSFILTLNSSSLPTGSPEPEPTSDPQPRPEPSASAPTCRDEIPKPWFQLPFPKDGHVAGCSPIPRSAVNSCCHLSFWPFLPVPSTATLLPRHFPAVRQTRGPASNMPHASASSPRISTHPSRPRSMVTSFVKSPSPPHSQTKFASSSVFPAASLRSQCGVKTT